ncbi:MAG: TVP38/TMEM64 family protein [Leptolyngbyaceae cyanobacterium bins.349]|nr:TVP38/TMEM64 family protein [Leptolyngbyaceae cyanobacterium bins.349]
MPLLEFLHSTLSTSLDWIQAAGWAGVFAYILLYSVATVFLIPGSLLTLGGGAIYGLGWGSLYGVTAATLGAIAAFLVGRSLARHWVEQRMANYASFQAIAHAVAQDGWKIVLLTRLSPLFPFTLLNYAFALTRVSLRDYSLGSVGMIPGTILYVYLGALAGDLAAIASRPPLSREAAMAQWIVRLLGLVATIIVTAYITRIARRALAQSLDSSEVADGSPEQK